ncbi:NAD-dependent epimerase/dehydratase family protein [Candidatus Pelagibacter sp.]|nr:NAD-dependent epimerase/dehydratase family protein [Candidatus Pelagibacter sp.]
MSVALITGSAGLVGSEAVKFFCDKGFDVVGIDNNLRKFFFGKDGSTSWVKKKLKRDYKNFYNYNTDIRNFNSLEKIFRKYSKKISIIIHCAAQPSHDYGKNYPTIDFNINATGTLNLLELTKKFCPESCFIFMSTNKVYGDNPNNLELYETKSRFELEKKNKYYKGINEGFSIDNCIHSFFGVSKTYADLIVQEYGRNVGLKTVSFRGGCITGPNHSGAKLHGFLSYLIKSCILEKKYTLIGYNGKQVRDNLHSNDLINCFWEYYKKPSRGEIYNIGGGRYSNCSILEALNLVEQKCNIKIKKKIIKSPRMGDHIWYISDTAKFRSHYPEWKQKYNTEKIIEELIDTHEYNPK